MSNPIPSIWFAFQILSIKSLLKTTRLLTFKVQGYSFIQKSPWSPVVICGQMWVNEDCVFRKANVLQKWKKEELFKSHKLFYLFHHLRLQLSVIVTHFHRERFSSTESFCSSITKCHCFEVENKYIDHAMIFMIEKCVNVNNVNSEFVHADILWN